MQSGSIARAAFTLATRNTFQPKNGSQVDPTNTRRIFEMLSQSLDQHPAATSNEPVALPYASPNSPNHDPWWTWPTLALALAGLLLPYIVGIMSKFQGR